MYEGAQRTQETIKQNIEAYSDMVYKLAYSLVKDKYDADDIYQEVFLSYIRHKPQFDSKEHEKAWFICVTVNFSKNLWKSAWRSKVTMLSESGRDMQEGMGKYAQNADGDKTVQMAISCGTDPALLLEDEDATLIEQVKSLPAKYRAVIHLFYYEDMTVEEISKALQRKPSTVRAQLTRAREMLRKKLKEDV